MWNGGVREAEGKEGVIVLRMGDVSGSMHR